MRKLAKELSLTPYIYVFAWIRSNLILFNLLWYVEGSSLNSRWLWCIGWYFWFSGRHLWIRWSLWFTVGALCLIDDASYSIFNNLWFNRGCFGLVSELFSLTLIYFPVLGWGDIYFDSWCIYFSVKCVKLIIQYSAFRGHDL